MSIHVFSLYFLVGVLFGLCVCVCLVCACVCVFVCVCVCFLSFSALYTLDSTRQISQQAQTTELASPHGQLCWSLPTHQGGKSQQSERAHSLPHSPPSFSLSHLRFTVGGKLASGEGTLIPAPPWPVVQSRGPFIPSLTFYFPICKIRVSDLVASDILVCLLSHLCLWVWSTTDNSAKRDVSVLSMCCLQLPSTILPSLGWQPGVFRQASTLPHTSWVLQRKLTSSPSSHSLPPPGPCASPKLICVLHPLGDLSPKWIQQLKPEDFVCWLGAKVPSSPGNMNQGTNSLPNWQASWSHEGRRLWKRNHHGGGGGDRKENLGLGHIIVKTPLKTHPVTSQGIIFNQLDFLLLAFKKSKWAQMASRNPDSLE